MIMIDAYVLYRRIEKLQSDYMAERSYTKARMCGKIKAIVGEMIADNTVDAEPVRHGRWVENDDGETICSECNGVSPHGWYWKYCPHCSAKMDGKEQEHERSGTGTKVR